MDRKVIDGAKEEMNSITSQNLDHASAQRQARQTFSIAQQNLDHLLLKGAPTGIVMEEGLHGYIPSFDGMVDQVIEQYDILKAKKEASKVPNFLLGQSMRAAVALKAHLKQPQEWDGIILVAPMCRISKGVTPPVAILKVFALMSYFLPEAKMFPISDTDNMTFRDPIKGKMSDYNVISYNDQMRLRTATELLKATSDVETQLEKVSAPLLILHGAANQITDPQASQLLYKKSCSQDKTLKLNEDILFFFITVAKYRRDGPLLLAVYPPYKEPPTTAAAAVDPAIVLVVRGTVGSSSTHNRENSEGHSEMQEFCYLINKFAGIGKKIALQKNCTNKVAFQSIQLKYVLGLIYLTHVRGHLHTMGRTVKDMCSFR
ncbi:Alpha/beta-Hydrolases superfamily protein [Zostera marina]|uniref:Alpha/beta-Hydrolases superfamily protein n=1 Tax=Zostera marina TaxID=29655 RepID=A0A0K9PST8_ZOSMR|nr:Alpha/beta-Hydrolases superfamily protein [Zostera marina]